MCSARCLAWLIGKFLAKINSLRCKLLQGDTGWFERQNSIFVTRILPAGLNCC